MDSHCHWRDIGQYLILATPDSGVRRNTGKPGGAIPRMVKGRVKDRLASVPKFAELDVQSLKNEQG